MQKLEVHGHPNDLHWAGATICWDKKRDCWVLPGGDTTRIERVALGAAKRIADVFADKRVFNRKEAA